MVGGRWISSLDEAPPERKGSVFDHASLLEGKYSLANERRWGEVEAD
jgi:hypothetical protein